MNEKRAFKTVKMKRNIFKTKIKVEEDDHSKENLNVSFYFYLDDYFNTEVVLDNLDDLENDEHRSICRILKDYVST